MPVTMRRYQNILEHMRSSTPKSPWLEAALMSAGNMYLLRKDYDKASITIARFMSAFQTETRQPMRIGSAPG